MAGGGARRAGAGVGAVVQGVAVGEQGKGCTTEREMAALDWDGFLRDVLGGQDTHAA